MTDTNKKGELILTRIFEAPRETVWKAWTDVEDFAKWYGSPGKSTNVVMDFKVGGEWHNTTVMPDGSGHPAIGSYTVIEQPEHLEFKMFDPENRDDSKFELISVTLKELAPGKTEMTFSQSGGNLPFETYETHLKAGLTRFFDKLEMVVNK